MRGHSNTALANRSPNHTGRWPTALGLLGALGLAACGGPGYGDYVYGPQGGDYSGKLALAWTLNGTAMTAERCQTERIDSMAVEIISERDAQSRVEFVNVVCGLSRYSVAMVPSGPVSVYINAIHVQKNQSECVRYAAIAHTTAGSQYPQTPTPVNLLAVGSCP
jgi:hypothetical protein